MSYRVVFDRSIFHKDKFIKLKESNIFNCVKKKKIRVYFTTAFFEETLKYEKFSKTDLKEQLKFLFSIDTFKWFKEIKDIIDLELNNKWCEHDYYLMSRGDIKQKRRDFEDIADGNINTVSAWKENEKIEERKGLFYQKLSYEKNIPITQKIDFSIFFMNEVDNFMKNELISKNHTNPEKLFSNWNNNRDKCRLTNCYVKALLALIYLARYDKNFPLDKNDRWDIEQLSFLTFADIMVSDDKLIPKVSDLIYSNKKISKLEDFLKFIQN